MSQLMLIGNRFVLCRSGVASAIRNVRSSSTYQQEAAKFFERHAQRKSPMSPFMFFLPLGYKPQLTSMLSITHRITGMGLGIVLYGIGIAELTNPKLSYDEILKKTKAVVPGALIGAIKFLCATAIAFHSFNGVRHLTWDAGYGFGIKTLYKSGYAVMGLTLLSVAYIIANLAK